jgi:hypothetical protein
MVGTATTDAADRDARKTSERIIILSGSNDDSRVFPQKRFLYKSDL